MNPIRGLPEHSYDLAQADRLTQGTREGESTWPLHLLSWTNRGS